ncbi:toll/interleukin-1 receptor domain-containing protein [Priestia megaterium]|uniref:toll/interleukin-1 receptor domain-containing protein n=1 Tax=Priestia megaterium TaxID=1404 RepID=UPI0027952860|nr:toll/interleukin-1 receptor domain-containing protein [Priestia megaterium]
MKKIFLHYTPDDIRVAESLSNFLRKSGYSILMETADMYYDSPFSTEIEFTDSFTNRFKETDLAIVLISQNYLRSPLYKAESEAFNQLFSSMKIPVAVVAIDDANPQFGFGNIGYFEADKSNILNENFGEITKILEVKKSEMYLAEKEATAEKESKKEVVQRISDSPELKKVISDLKKREKFSKGIAMACYFIGIAGIIGGAILAYLSVYNIPSNNTNSYFYIYIGIKNLAIIGVLILCSRYTFNIGKIYNEEGVKQADRLHAINYGKFFLESFQEKLSFEEMKELFKDWNMDNKPLSPNTLDTSAVDSNTANTSNNSEASIVVDLLGKLIDLLSNQKK